MKAITIWQPWASLLASGRKRYETRSWATTYRGPIAIHAAKRPVATSLRRLLWRSSHLWNLPWVTLPWGGTHGISM